MFEEREQSGTEMFRFACLLTGDAVADALRDPGWEFDTGEGAPGFTVRFAGGDERAEYETAAAKGVVPVVYYRTFTGVFPDVVELAEDFRLFWGLYHEQREDGGRWLTVDDAGDAVVVAEQTPALLRIRKSFLRRYQAARQLHLSVQFNIFHRGGEELRATAEANVAEAAENMTRIAYGGGRAIPDDGTYSTRCLGKHVFPPPPVEECGVWPFEPARSYMSFAIGTDDVGSPIEHTCDPDALSDYFGGNPGAPHFLTPVFFRRAVLDKYYGDPGRYRVTDGYLYAGAVWSLPIDNALEEHVAVFLGDLGRLPDREQAYWKSFNVAPEDSLSDVAIRRSFLGQFADTDRIEYRFSRAYTAVNAAWAQRFGWPLFKDLNQGDAHLAHSLRVPTNSGFAAFDAQLIGLAKLVVDCLNEEELGKSATAKSAGEKGIAKLERFVRDQGLSASGNPLCATLRQVQGARSRSSAHRKGSDFDEALLLDGAPDLPSLFETLLSSLATSFEQLRDDLTASPAP